MKDRMEDVSALRQQVKRLCASQKLCVLATQYDGQPYSNLVAFAETGELRNLIFVTSRSTRKYANSISNRKVAVMIDSRKNRTADFKTALAVTAIGVREGAGCTRGYLCYQASPSCGICQWVRQGAYESNSNGLYSRTF